MLHIDSLGLYPQLIPKLLPEIWLGRGFNKLMLWFFNTMTPELFKKAYGHLPNDLKVNALEDLIDGVDRI
jgi:hypothetical protein